MKIADVKKMDRLSRFYYWMKERHQVHLKRKAGKPKPWTDDEVLQQFFFTNPYRENDKTTVWFRDTVRDPLREDPAVLFATVAFRWFNYIPTGVILIEDGVHEFGLLENWSAKRAVKLLENEDKIFTGAYMIKSPTGRRKVESIAECVTNVWNAREKLVDFTLRNQTLQGLCGQLAEFPYLGGFMSYEIVCDLRYTYLLRNATDKMTWCNPGPGAKRGLMRMAGQTPPNNRFGRQKRTVKAPKDWQAQMIKLLADAPKRTGLSNLEMREIEHSLCEWDKYERALAGTGKMKRTYNGVT